MSQAQYLYWQNFFKSHPFWKWFASAFASQIVYVYVALPFALVWSLRGRQFIGVAGAALIIAWGIIVQSIAVLFPTPRPYQKYNFVPASGKALFSRVTARYDAFPSGHATALTALTVTIAFFSVPAAILSGAAVLVTGVCRVLLGYHFVFDIVAGVCIGAGVVLFLQYSGLFAQIMTFIR